MDPRSTSTNIKSADEVLRQLSSDSNWRIQLQAVVDRIDLRGDGFDLALKLQSAAQGLKLSKHFPMRMRRRGAEMKMVIEGPSSYVSPSYLTLLKAISNALRWFEELSTGRAKSIAEIARREQIDKRQASRLLYLAFLSPRIVEAALSGTQLIGFTTTDLSRDLELDPDWDLQHQMLGLT